VLKSITHPSTIASEALSKIIEAIVTGESSPVNGSQRPRLLANWGSAADLSGKRE
jgi:hypothetical protein